MKNGRPVCIHNVPGTLRRNVLTTFLSTLLDPCIGHHQRDTAATCKHPRLQEVPPQPDLFLSIDCRGRVGTRQMPEGVRRRKALTSKRTNFRFRLPPLASNS
eukprot:6344925-Pyramimonas_sp.AAC.1